MKKEKNLFWFVCLLVLSATVLSCSDDDSSPEHEKKISGNGIYLLSNGIWGQNNSMLDFYDFETGEVAQNVFQGEGNRGLGDTANDLLVYGSKIYIAVTTSNRIEITDLCGKSLSYITPENGGSRIAGPRYLTASEGKVYVSMSGGYVARIDTAGLVSEDIIEVGAGAEGICASGGKIYVSISVNPSPSTFVKEINPATLEVKQLDVIDNPTQIRADKNGLLYVVSGGNSDNAWTNTLVKLNPATGDTTTLFVSKKLYVEMAADHLYVLASEVDADGAIETQYLKYDVVKQVFETKPFVSEDVTIKYVQSVAVDDQTGEIYITSGKYTTTGFLHILTKDGREVKTASLSGMNPMGISVNRN